MTGAWLASPTRKSDPPSQATGTLNNTLASGYTIYVGLSCHCGLCEVISLTTPSVEATQGMRSLIMPLCQGKQHFGNKYTDGLNQYSYTEFYFVEEITFSRKFGKRKFTLVKHILVDRCEFSSPNLWSRQCDYPASLRQLHGIRSPAPPLLPWRRNMFGKKFTDLLTINILLCTRSNSFRKLHKGNLNSCKDENNNIFTIRIK